MAKRPARSKKKPATHSNGSEFLRPAPALPDLTMLLPRDWRRSPAWKHFQTAQVEFLTGMQYLMKDLLERMKMRPEDESQLKRIDVEK